MDLLDAFCEFDRLKAGANSMQMCAWVNAKRETVPPREVNLAAVPPVRGCERPLAGKAGR
jgi:hypothetical protein